MQRKGDREQAGRAGADLSDATRPYHSLTPLGKEAAEKVRVLVDWIEESMPRIAEHWRESGTTRSRKTSA